MPEYVPYCEDMKINSEISGVILANLSHGQGILLSVSLSGEERVQPTSDCLIIQANVTDLFYIINFESIFK